MKIFKEQNKINKLKQPNKIKITINYKGLDQGNYRGY